MNQQDSEHKPAVDDPLAKLLAQSGPRPMPPSDVMEQVRNAVHREWQQMLQRRQRQRQRRWLAAASVLLVAGGAWWTWQYQFDNGVAIPVVAVLTDAQSDALLNDKAIATQRELHAGDILQTHSGAHVQINGLDLRIAAQSTLTFATTNQVQLEQGALYVDSHELNTPLVIHTVRGDITHLGTRYLVDVNQGAVNVAVRAGQVAVTTNADTLTVNAAEQLALDADGQVERSALNLEDSRWQWANALATPFELENHSMADFLDWVSNETGYKLHYQDQATVQVAQQIVLHGNRTTLPPLQALQAVLATTDLQVRTENDELVVRR